MITPDFILKNYLNLKLDICIDLLVQNGIISSQSKLSTSTSPVDKEIAFYLPDEGMQFMLSIQQVVLGITLYTNVEFLPAFRKSYQGKIFGDLNNTITPLDIITLFGRPKSDYPPSHQRHIYERIFQYNFPNFWLAISWNPNGILQAITCGIPDYPQLRNEAMSLMWAQKLDRPTI